MVPGPDGPENRGTQRDHLRRAIGWTHWPFFVWRRVPPGEPGGPGAILSILHTGYLISGLVLVLDGALWLGLGLPAAPLFLLGHLLWISLWISLLLLNTRFLEFLDGRPLPRLGWANRLTVARVSFLPLLLYLLWLRHWGPALAGYILLGLTDIADGFVARRLGEESKLGFLLDPLVDILFHLGILISLSAAGVLSWTTGGLVLARFGLLLSGCAALYLWKGEIWIQPTPFGKATGLAIAGLTGLLLLALGTGGDPIWLLHWIDLLLRVLFAAGLIHVVVIGWINFRRPPQGGIAVYLRGWGLLIGHGARPTRIRRRGAGGTEDK